jgi:hypothetical protein
LKIVLTALPSSHWLAHGQGRFDWVQWGQDQPLKDEDFFEGATDRFRRELRRQLKWLLRQAGEVKA